MKLRIPKEKKAYRQPNGAMAAFINQNTYGVTLLIVWSATHQQYIDTIEAWCPGAAEILGHDGKAAGTYATLTSPDGMQRRFAIWLKDHKKTARAMAVLAHEISHVTFEICEWTGIQAYPGHPDNNEAWCYLHTELMEETLNILEQKAEK